MVKVVAVTPSTSDHNIHRELVDGETDAARRYFGIATENHTLIPRVLIAIL